MADEFKNNEFLDLLKDEIDNLESDELNEILLDINESKKICIPQWFFKENFEEMLKKKLTDDEAKYLTHQVNEFFTNQFYSQVENFVKSISE